MGVKSISTVIPDYRFEQSFLNSLQRYANFSAERSERKAKSEVEGTEKASKSLNSTFSPYNALSPSSTHSADDLVPLAPITPGIVIYAVAKEIILYPLVGGMLWTTGLMLVRPMLQALTTMGFKCAVWIRQQLGLPVNNIY